MLIHQLAQGFSLMGLLCQGLHLDWQLAVQEQVRAGDSYTPGVAGSQTISLAEIVAPSGQAHLTFNRANQDLLVRYQPRFLDTLQILPGGGGSQWTGWSQMHRALVQYAVGNERDVALKAAINFTAGKLDVSDPDGLVEQSGFLPGRLGTLVNYTNINGTFALTHKVGRSLRLTSTEMLGMVQYPANPGIGYFRYAPNVTAVDVQGNETQLRIGSKNSGEIIFNKHDSLFLEAEFLDVSYQETASYPAVMPSVGYSHQFSSLSRIRLDGGAMKYWTNPVPGIIKSPRYLPIANLVFDHSFVTWGAPHWTTHVTAGVKPYFNLQYSSLEPRTTLMWQLAWAATRSFSVLGSARLLSSKFGGFTQWQKLPGGHPKNIFLLNLGVHYNYRDILVVDANAYASDQSYEASATQPYTQLRQVYVLLGLRGTWQKRPRG
jgi:hypothetical protein